ncbi:MAG: hypothetical protein CL623_08230 [Arcobacter sp.]|nr:hypothetical protein [Arcobacter sp.]|tara:strand:- start:11180 stop:13303 length:2124 start_codon:yes stop_codon:yes gene_type:complete
MIQEVYKSFERPYSIKYGVLVQNIILINVLINIFASFGSDIFHFTNEVKQILLIIEYTTVSIFLIELIARYISIGYDNKYKGLKGRLRYSFTPFILIDIFTLISYLFTSIPGDILLARVVRFLRFFRILKFLRLKDTIRNLFSISNFATSSIFYQFIVLFILSSFFIILFSFVYASGEKTSLMIFLDPPALAETSSHTEMAFGVIELLIGLFIGGALISIITELLTNISRDIKNGYYPYKGENHIVIINQNSKLEFILNEINYYYKDIEQLQDVLIFLPFENDIENFGQNLKEYSNINIVLIKGDLLNWNSYIKLNINRARKLLILEEKTDNTKYLNIKISRYLLSNKHFDNQKLKFIIESENNKTLKMVYEEIFRDTKNKYRIINHNNIVESFLNRSIIEPDYFKVYTNLLSFEDFEFYTLNFEDIFKEEITFRNASMQFIDGILIGIIRDNSLILNPNKDLILLKNDKIITILKNKLEYSIDIFEDNSIQTSKISRPKLKTSRDICIMGNYDDIQEKQIIEFLTPESVENLERIVLDNNNYIEDNFWDRIVSQNYDMIILNMPDDDEFILTMYLRNRYQNNHGLLNSIVNIINDPVNAKLLIDTKLKHNIILSEKLVGEYITQVIFNSNIVTIFDEITQSKGNEFYILDKNDYEPLFELEYVNLKLNLLENNMIYIGAIVNDKFMVNNKNVRNNERIIVLTQGID